MENEEEGKKRARLQIIYYSILCLLVFILLPLFAILGNYSAIALFFVPFGIGLVFAFLMALRKQRRFGSMSIIPIILSIAALFFIAGEGVICLIIFGSILLIPYFIGILIGSINQIV